MLRIALLTGLLMCGGSGFAAYKQLNPDATVAGMTQSTVHYLAGTTSRLFGGSAAHEAQAERPRIAQLPQASGVRNRGNTSLAERRMRATASAMVERAPAARALRDANRQASHERRWSKLFRKTPKANTERGRLNGIQSRARERAEQQAHFNELWKANGNTGPAPTLPEGVKLKKP